MCVIIAKDKSNRLPTKKELQQCFEHNPDGAGFMYTDKGQVIIDKGYMDFDSFMARYVTLCKRYNYFKDKSLVIHCRIGTAGSNTAQNTHPYPLTKSVKKLHKTYFKTHLGIAHNGIIRDYQPDGEEDINDTQNFIKTYMTHKFKEDNKFYTRKYEQDIMEHITNSKLAILDNKDNLYLIGHYNNEDNLKFSNTYFKPYAYTDYWDTYDSCYATRRASHVAQSQHYKYNDTKHIYERIG